LELFQSKCLTFFIGCFVLLYIAVAALELFILEKLDTCCEQIDALNNICDNGIGQATPFFSITTVLFMFMSMSMSMLLVFVLLFVLPPDCACASSHHY
jgi:hypothetical protein